MYGMVTVQVQGMVTSKRMVIILAMVAVLGIATLLKNGYPLGKVTMLEMSTI